MADGGMIEDAAAAEASAPLDFDCPRCGRPATATFWGPCSSCRDEMAATMSREARDVEVAAYEPKMNVVPNQVATKD